MVGTAPRPMPATVAAITLKNIGVRSSNRVMANMSAVRIPNPRTYIHLNFPPRLNRNPTGTPINANSTLKGVMICPLMVVLIPWTPCKNIGKYIKMPILLKNDSTVAMAIVRNERLRRTRGYLYWSNFAY